MPVDLLAKVEFANVPGVMLASTLLTPAVTLRSVAALATAVLKKLSHIRQCITEQSRHVGGSVGAMGEGGAP